MSRFLWFTVYNEQMNSVTITEQCVYIAYRRYWRVLTGFSSSEHAYQHQLVITLIGLACWPPRRRSRGDSILGLHGDKMCLYRHENNTLKCVDRPIAELQYHDYVNLHTRELIPDKLWLRHCRSVVLEPHGRSGVTRVGVTWCGNWWCHPFYLKKWWYFLVIVVKSADFLLLVIFVMLNDVKSYNLTCADLTPSPSLQMIVCPAVFL